MNVRFSDDASTDLDAIEAYIRRHTPHRALTDVRELALSAIAIGDIPDVYPTFVTAAGQELRRKIHGSYLIIYRLRGGEVEIVRFLHGARDISRLLGAEGE